MDKELSLKELHDRLIEMLAQIKANEIIAECNVTTPEAKTIILDACRTVMNEIYASKYGCVD